MAYIEIWDVGHDYVSFRFRKLSGAASDYNRASVEIIGWGTETTNLSSGMFSSDGTGYLKSNPIVIYKLTPNTTYRMYVEIETNTWYPVESEDGYPYSRFTTLREELPDLEYPRLYLDGVGTTYIDISWGTVSGAISYYVYLDNRYMGSTGTSASQRQWSFTGLTPGRNYAIYVTAWDGDRESNELWTNLIEVRTEQLSPPKTPTLTKDTQTLTSATMIISNYGTATHFEVQGRRDDTSNWSYYSYEAYNPYTATGLLNGRTYDFRVRGVNDSGYSSWSNIITFNIGSPRPSDWVWEYTILPGSNFWNQTGNTVFLMRASHWNSFTDTINLFRAYKLGSGYNYSFTQATTSTTETGIRICVNQAIDKVNDMVSNKIPNVYSGDTVKASTFTLLRDRLNSL